MLNGDLAHVLLSGIGGEVNRMLPFLSPSTLHLDYLIHAKH